MSGTSDLGGDIAAPSTDGLYGQALDIVLQNWIVALSGLRPDLVRVRNQPVAASYPTDQSTNWASVGFNEEALDPSPFLAADPTDTETSVQQSYSELSAMVAFAGPNAHGIAAATRAAMSIGQNREQLNAYGILFVGAGRLRLVSEQISEIWVRRVDMDLTFRRQVDRRYAIRRLVESSPTVINDPT